MSPALETPSGTWSDLGQIAVVVLAVVAVVVRRLAGEPVRARRLLLAPAIAVIGVIDLIENFPERVSAFGVMLLLVEMAVSAAGGVARGASVLLYDRDGALWQSYRTVTVLLWLLVVLVHLLIAAGGLPALTTTSLVLSLGLGLSAEAAWVSRRVWLLRIAVARAHGVSQHLEPYRTPRRPRGLGSRLIDDVIDLVSDRLRRR